MVKERENQPNLKLDRIVLELCYIMRLKLHVCLILNANKKHPENKNGARPIRGSSLSDYIYVVTR